MFFNFISKVGTAGAYSGLAEEAAELSAAASKMARVLRKEDPTPVTADEAFSHVVEEYNDVLNWGSALVLPRDEEGVDRKRDRFIERWRQHVLKYCAGVHSDTSDIVSLLISAVPDEEQRKELIYKVLDLSEKCVEAIKRV